jgi:hypothetical protein
MTPHEHIHALKLQLSMLESSLHTPQEVQQEDPGNFSLVQLHPTADKVWGGMLLRGKRVRSGRIEGYLLRPHRGDHREAWYSARLCEVTPLAAIPFPEPAWGFRDWAIDPPTKRPPAKAKGHNENCDACRR